MATERTNEGRRQQMLRQDEVPSGGGTQGSSDADSGPPQPGMMLGLWMPWMERYFGAARDWIDSDKPWWQVTPYDLIDNMLAGGVKQFDDIIAKDPLLGSIDQMWNANPLRKVVPIDWAEITRALRTVWLHSLRKPEKAMASGADLYMTLWRSTMDTWNEAGQRWWGMAGTDQSQGPATAPSDKRFAAPEWRNNPIYRTLKELYLLASDWLLKQGEIEGMDEAERQRLNFHLRQFVDAMSPSLLLVSNPDALRRAMETGGASLADGAAQPAERPEGRPSQHRRSDGLRAGSQPRPDAGQGGPPQPADRADPVRADDRDRARDPAADRTALDQQVLHPRHAAEEQHGAVPGRAGLHRLHHLLEEPGRVDGRPHDRGLHGPRSAGGQRGRARDHRQRHRERDGLLHRRHAADLDAGLAGRSGRRPVRLGNLHGLAAGLLEGR